jgi:hypothetical protein
MGAILLIDLQDPGVLVVGRRKHARRLSREEDRGIGAVAVDLPTDEDHRGKRRTNASDPSLQPGPVLSLPMVGKKEPPVRPHITFAPAALVYDAD